MLRIEIKSFSYFNASIVYFSNGICNAVAVSLSICIAHIPHTIKQVLSFTRSCIRIKYTEAAGIGQQSSGFQFSSVYFQLHYIQFEEQLKIQEVICNLNGNEKEETIAARISAIN